MVDHRTNTQDPSLWLLQETWLNVKRLDGAGNSWTVWLTFAAFTSHKSKFYICMRNVISMSATFERQKNIKASAWTAAITGALFLFILLIKLSSPVKTEQPA